ncbi:hypothetical protein AVEN_147958-1 [Araneus ventricosus]|uniref:Reverse transcriptase/retrotransposon-derived protein RNase H-like domain-containing protein n=1 Tax=Araneus ventricosus TaxID=182803 RepID=A0A4Y2SSB8_ARAVE|nr:hypothetical protein AVEN_147958-1 [Araneus ventricosus]
MVNYLNRFIPNIATILSPLNQLLVGAKNRDKREILWNIETEKSFQDIRDAMAKVTLLYHPSVDAKLAFVIDCMYGSSLRLPGQRLEEKRIDQCPDCVARLQRLFRTVRPTFPLRHGPQRIYIPKDLETCSHVFLLRHPFKKTLQTLYEGPFNVLRRLPKDFIILIKGQERFVAMDRMKPAFILNASDEPTEQEHQTYHTRFGRRAKFRLPA